jgi:hypothetical protein
MSVHWARVASRMGHPCSRSSSRASPRGESILSFRFALRGVISWGYARNYSLPCLSKSELQAWLAGPTKLVFFGCVLFFLAGVLLFSAASLRACIPAPSSPAPSSWVDDLEPVPPLASCRCAHRRSGGAPGCMWLGSMCRPLPEMQRQRNSRQPVVA